MEEKKYFSEINIARGIAVLLVLLGHAFPDAQVGIRNYAAKWIFDFLYSFHMGAFFVLSGFVASRKLYSGELKFADELIKKVKRLFIPYIVYSIITLILKLFLNAYANNAFYMSDAWKILIGINPNGGLWYLWTLFFIYLLAVLLCKAIKKLNITAKTAILLAVGVAGYILSVTLPFNDYTTGLKRIIEWAVFFNLGMVIACYYKGIKGKAFNVIVGIIAVLITFMINCPSFGLDIPYVFTGILGSYGVLSIAIAVSRNEGSGLFKALDLFGSYSYDIYLLSYFVMVALRVVLWTMLGINYWFCFATMFILGLVVSIIVSKLILRRVGLFKKLFIGDWS